MPVSRLGLFIGGNVRRRCQVETLNPNSCRMAKRGHQRLCNGVCPARGNGADLDYRCEEIWRARSHTRTGGENTNCIPFHEKAQG